MTFSIFNIPPNRLYPVLALGACVMALAGAYTAQYVFGLEPCILCLYQRIPFAIGGALAIVGVARPEHAKVIMAILIGVFLFEAGLAFYHVGVEQHWWVAATGCSSSGEISANVAEMLKNIQKPSPKPCDEVDWAILGISMASWNVLFSIFLAGGAVLGWRQIK